MTISTEETLVLIGIVAVISPILTELTRRLAIPDVVIEIALGIVIGPAVLGLAHPDSVIVALEEMGLSYLMFLAGLELDLPRIRGRSLQLAATGWAISLAVAMLIGTALTVIGTVLDAIVIGLALTTTALGTLLPILRDAGLFEGRDDAAGVSHAEHRGSDHDAQGDLEHHAGNAQPPGELGQEGRDNGHDPDQHQRCFS